jgi:predicted nucleic acid-binding protein
MREVVVDASVAAKWVVEERHSSEAARLLNYDALHAPAHWRAEAVNVLWAKVWRGDLTEAEAEERVRTLNGAPIIEASIAPLVPRAFTIAVAHSVTIYDSLYVALAEQLDVALVSADAKLIQCLSSDATPGKRMIWVGNVPP